MNHEGHNGSQRTRENITQTADGTILPALSACWSGLLRLFPENNPVEHLGIVDCLIACFATARVQRGRSPVKIRFSTASAIHVMDGLTGLALRIGNFLQRALQNGAAEDRTGQVKTIKLTAMPLQKETGLRG